jgi:hypothetical protein
MTWVRKRGRELRHPLPPFPRKRESRETGRLKKEKASVEAVLKNNKTMLNQTVICAL